MPAGDLARLIPQHLLPGWVRVPEHPLQVHDREEVLRQAEEPLDRLRFRKTDRYALAATGFVEPFTAPGVGLLEMDTTTATFVRHLVATSRSLAAGAKPMAEQHRVLPIVLARLDPTGSNTLLMHNPSSTGGNLSRKERLRRVNPSTRRDSAYAMEKRITNLSRHERMYS